MPECGLPQPKHLGKYFPKQLQRENENSPHNKQLEELKTASCVCKDQ